MLQAHGTRRDECRRLRQIPQLGLLQGEQVTVVKPKQSHPWNASISRDVHVTKLKAEIEDLRKQLKAKDAEIKLLRAKLLRK